MSEVAEITKKSEPLFSKKNRKLITDPLDDHNPITVQVLGICSALAITVQVKQAVVMSISVLFVMIMGNFLISAMRNSIPDRIRIIVQLVVVASLVILVDQTLKAFVYDVSKALSVFVGLIITNCIIMGRLEAFALGNKPGPSVLDAIGNAMGYAWILIAVSVVREILGSGKLMGFDLGINFNFPYKARNITEFWRRWHISLSSWLRDYLYIPLGGNRKGKVRMYINLFITMFLGGLWHGASWKFVFWGACHGLALAVHKAFKKNMLDKIPDKLPSNSISWVVTFIFVIFLWIFFRAGDIPHEVYKFNQEIVQDQELVASIIYKDGKNSLDIKFVKDSAVVRSELIPIVIDDTISVKTKKQKINYKENNLVINRDTTANVETIKVSRIENGYSVAWSMISKIVTDTDFAYAWPFIKARYTWFIFVVIGFLMHTISSGQNEKIMQGFVRAPYILKILIFIVLIQLVVQFKPEGVQPFIYFQF